MELIQAIVLLCQLSASGDIAPRIALVQTNCHKYYAECLDKKQKGVGYDFAIRECIKHKP